MSLVIEYVVNLASQLLDVLIISSTTAHMLVDLLQFLLIIKMLRAVFSHLYDKTYENLTLRDFHRMFGVNAKSRFLYNFYHCQFDLNGIYSGACTVIMKLSEGVGKLSLHKWMASMIIPASVQAIGNWFLLLAVIVLAISLIAGFVDDHFISPRVKEMKAFDARPKKLIDHTNRVLHRQYHHLNQSWSFFSNKDSSYVQRIPAQGLERYWSIRDRRAAYFHLLLKFRDFGQLIKKSFRNSESPSIEVFDNLSRIGFDFNPTRVDKATFNLNGDKGTVTDGGSMLNLSAVWGRVNASPVFQRVMTPVFNLFPNASPGIGEEGSNTQPGAVSSYRSSSSISSVQLSHGEHADRNADPILEPDAIRDCVLRAVNYMRAQLDDAYEKNRTLSDTDYEALVSSYQEINPDQACRLSFMRSCYEFLRKSYNIYVKEGKLPGINSESLESGCKKSFESLEWIMENLPCAFPKHDKYVKVRRFISERCLPALCLYYELDVHDDHLSEHISPALRAHIFKKFPNSRRDVPDDSSFKQMNMRACMRSHHARIISLIVTLIDQSNNSNHTGHRMVDRLEELLNDLNAESSDPDRLASSLDIHLLEDHGRNEYALNGNHAMDQRFYKTLKDYALLLERSLTPKVRRPVPLQYRFFDQEIGDAKLCNLLENEQSFIPIQLKFS
tara:strand:+ start:3417 stop:5426 length:2010 start_codon:yes stop_codon:yes gene_type:complete